MSLETESRDFSDDDETTVVINELFDTYVLWDVVDFPAPVDPDLTVLRWNIKNALRREGYSIAGYSGELSINVYGGELSDDEVDSFRSADMLVASEGVGFVKRKRGYRMLRDMLYWARNYPRVEFGGRRRFCNFLIIAKGFDEQKDSDFLYVLQELNERDHLISLVVPDDYCPLQELLPEPRLATKGILSTAESVWLWKVLCDGGDAIETESDLHQETSLDVVRRILAAEEEELEPPQAKVTNKVYFDVKIGGKEAGRIVMGLFGEAVPETADHFRAMFTGDNKYSYKGTSFLVDKGCSIQGGKHLPGNDAVLMKYLTAYDRNFDIEADNSVLKHTGPGILSMMYSNRFFISTTKEPRLEDKHVVFGQVIQGMKLVRVIESQPTIFYGLSAPLKDCIIYACGQLPVEA